MCARIKKTTLVEGVEKVGAQLLKNNSALELNVTESYVSTVYKNIQSILFILGVEKGN